MDKLVSTPIRFDLNGPSVLVGGGILGFNPDTVRFELVQGVECAAVFHVSTPIRFDLNGLARHEII